MKKQTSFCYAGSPVHQVDLVAGVTMAGIDLHAIKVSVIVVH